MPDRWHAITAIFHAAIVRDGPARTAFVAEACRGNPSLRDEIEALIAAHEAASEWASVPGLGAQPAIQLAPDTQLGRYRIETRLGSGGMGEVYRARDTRLDRVVAIKVLPPHLRLSPDREARFEREARLVSQLTHPHICTLYDIGREGDTAFLVMEFLDGETLGSRVARGRVPLADVLRIGFEIASALAYAHRHEVIHRDVKPSNVMLTKSGTKLLDFGVAKLRAAGGTTPSGARMADTGTKPGAMVGTLAYMAPEQLQGGEADARTDIWALGCVLYELTTGRPAFEATNPASLIAAILEHDPVPLMSVDPLAPPVFDHLIRTCLAKDPQERWQSASDVARELQWIDRSDGRAPSGTVRRVLGRYKVHILTACALLILTLVGAALKVSHVRPSGTDGPFEISTAVTWPSEESHSRLSPDGAWLSFVSDRDGDPRLFVRNVKSGEATAIAAPSGGVLGAAWSPDGQELAILLKQSQAATVQIVPAFFGGAAKPIARVEEPARIVRWIGTTLYLEHRANLLAVDTVSGAITEILRPDATRFPLARAFDVARDLRIAFSAQADGNEDVWLTDAKGSSPVRVTDHAASDGSPVLAGDYLYFQSSRGGQADVWRMNLVSRALTQVTAGSGELLPEDATVDGKLLSATYSAPTSEIWAIDSSTRRPWAVTADSVQDLWPSLSADGTVVAYQRRKRTLDTSYIEGEAEIVVGRWTGAQIAERRVAVTSGFAPRVSADGRWLAYLDWTGVAPGFVTLKAHDLATARTITVTKRYLVPTYFTSPLDWRGVNFVWSRDESALLFCDRDGTGATRIARIRPGDSSQEIVEVVKLPQGETIPRDLWPSPNGRSLAYNRYDIQSTVVVVRDLVSGVEEEWLADTHGRQGAVQILGWDGPQLIVIRSRRTEGLAQSLEFLALSGPARHTVLLTHPRGYAPTARLDTADQRVIATLQENGLDNLFALPLHAAPVRLTSNDRPAVTFSNTALLPKGVMLFARHDRKQDIWLVRQSQHD